MAGERYITSEDDHCPSCEREVGKLEDYPRVRLTHVDIITPPESLVVESNSTYGVPFDMAGAIKEVFSSEQVKKYLTLLQESLDQVRKPSELLPSDEPIVVKYPFPWREHISAELAKIYLYTRRGKQERGVADLGMRGVFGTVTEGGSSSTGYYNVSFIFASLGFEGLFLKTSSS